MPKKKSLKKTITFEDDTSIFPSDILLNILAKVQVKSLLRFKAVSKPWNAIISDDGFKKTHSDESKALGRKKLLLKSSRNVFEFRDLESSQLHGMENQLFPLKTYQRAKILCSCDGLVLLRNPGGCKNYVLWNPSTREYRTFPCPDNPLYYNNEPGSLCATGLCFDSGNGDYKVILIYDLSYAIYSLINDSWTTRTSLPCPIRPLEHNFGTVGISTEGCIFWSLNRGVIRHYVDRTSTIMYFDVKSGELKILPTPYFVGDNNYFVLSSVKSCLSLHGGNTRSLSLDIWIMEQDRSWKWLMNIQNLPCICQRFARDIMLLGCTQNGDYVFQGWYYHQIFIYYSKQQLFTETQISGEASMCLDSLYSSSLSVKRKRKRRSVV